MNTNMLTPFSHMLVSFAQCSVMESAYLCRGQVADLVLAHAHSQEPPQLVCCSRTPEITRPLVTLRLKSMQISHSHSALHMLLAHGPQRVQVRRVSDAAWVRVTEAFRLLQLLSVELLNERKYSAILDDLNRFQEVHTGMPYTAQMPLFIHTHVVDGLGKSSKL